MAIIYLGTYLYELKNFDKIIEYYNLVVEKNYLGATRNLRWRSKKEHIKAMRDLSNILEIHNYEEMVKYYQYEYNNIYIDN